MYQVEDVGGTLHRSEGLTVDYRTDGVPHACQNGGRPQLRVVTHAQS
jgi:hypothetical protein